MSQQINFSDNPKSNLKAMQILAAALVIGIIIFSILVVVINKFTGPLIDEKLGEPSNIFIYAAVILGLGCLLIALFFYIREMEGIKQSTSGLNERLNKYRICLIKFMALCEGGALFSIIIVFLTGELRLFGITALLAAVMAFKIPTKNKLIKELELDWKDQEEL